MNLNLRGKTKRRSSPYHSDKIFLRLQAYIPWLLFPCILEEILYEYLLQVATQRFENSANMIQGVCRHLNTER